MTQEHDEQLLAAERNRSRMQSAIIVSTAVFVAMVAGLVFLIIKARGPVSPSAFSATKHDSSDGIDAAGMYDEHGIMLKTSSNIQREGKSVLTAQNHLKRSLAAVVDGIASSEENTRIDLQALSVIYGTMTSNGFDEEDRLKRGLERLQACYGETSRIYVGTFVNNLAAYMSRILAQDGKEDSLYFFESMNMIEEALRIRRGVFGDKPHPHVAETMINMAVILMNNRRDEQRAAALGREAYEILKSTLGEDHEKTRNAKADWIDAS